MKINNFEFTNRRIASTNIDEEEDTSSEDEVEEVLFSEDAEEPQESEMQEEVLFLEQPEQSREMAPQETDHANSIKTFDDRKREIKQRYEEVKKSIYEDMAKCLVPLPQSSISNVEDFSHYNGIRNTLDNITQKSLESLLSQRLKNILSALDVKNISSAINKIVSRDLKITKEEFYSISKDNAYLVIYSIWMSNNKYVSNDDCKKFFKDIIFKISNSASAVIATYSADGTAETYFKGCVPEKSEKEKGGFLSRIRFW